MADAKIACPSCGGAYTRAGMGRHLVTCLGEGPGRLLLVESARSRAYWLFVLAGPEATLYDLDGLLRDTWLECCDHLSAFTVAGTRYHFDRAMVGSDWQDRSMDEPIAAVLQPDVRFTYEYDFGSTTELAGRAVGAVAVPDGTTISVLARNAPPSGKPRGHSNSPRAGVCGYPR